MQHLEAKAQPRLRSADLHILSEIVSFAHHRTLSQRLHLEVGPPLSCNKNLFVCYVLRAGHFSSAAQDCLALQGPVTGQICVICLQIPLSHIFLAYKAVLPQHGITAAEDTYYYRLLIALSLRPESSWWAKLDAERQRLTSYSRSAWDCPEHHQHGRSICDAQQQQSLQQPDSSCEEPGSAKVRHVPRDQGCALQRPKTAASAAERDTTDTWRLPGKPNHRSGHPPAACRASDKLHDDMVEKERRHPVRPAIRQELEAMHQSFTILARQVCNGVRQQDQLQQANRCPVSNTATEPWQEIADRFLGGREAQQTGSLSHANPAEGKASPRKSPFKGNIEGLQAASCHASSHPGRRSVNNHAQLQRTLSDVSTSHTIRHSSAAVQGYSDEVSLVKTPRRYGTGRLW